MKQPIDQATITITFEDHHNKPHEYSMKRFEDAEYMYEWLFDFLDSRDSIEVSWRGISYPLEEFFTETMYQEYTRAQS